MAFTNDNIGDEIELTYPQGTTFTTIVVENTCPVCGDTYIGPKEEVAHLLAQKDISVTQSMSFAICQHQIINER